MIKVASLVGSFKKGKVQINVISGDYQGKPTTSFTIKKQVLKDGKWTDSDFYTITDMMDVQAILGRIISQYVKYKKIEPKPKEETPEENIDESETPF